ncbi:MAG: hypothetical protein HY904_19055 [Deltaproteobacteria bacterium]|nr:hypothetical protein [Deltaproteobacteria bacterium]
MRALMWCSAVACAAACGPVPEPPSAMPWDGGDQPWSSSAWSWQPTSGPPDAGPGSSSSSSSRRSSSASASASASGPRVRAETAVSPVSADLHAVAALPDGTAWAVGAAGTLLRQDRGQWAAFPSPTGHTLWAVAAADDGTVLAAGDRGTLLRFNGVAFDALATAASLPLNGAWVGNAHEALVVGGQAGGAGVILRVDGEVVVDETPPNAPALYGVARDRVLDLDVAVGEGGAVYTRAAGAWSLARVPDSGALLRVAAAPGGAVALGIGGALVQVTGPATVGSADGTPGALGLTWWAGSQVLVVVGAGGRVRTGLPGGLADVAVPTAVALWGAAPLGDGLTVVGERGTILRLRWEP